MKTAKEVAASVADEIRSITLSRDLHALEKWEACIAQAIEQDRAEREVALGIKDLAERFNTTPENAAMVALIFATTTDGVLDRLRDENKRLDALATANGEAAQRLTQEMEGKWDAYDNLKAQVNELREALKPFILAWENLEPLQQGSEAYVIMKLNDYHRAAQVYKETEK